MDRLLLGIDPLGILLFNLIGGCIFLVWIILERETKAAATIAALEDEVAGFKVLLLEASYQLDKARARQSGTVIQANCDDLLEDIETFLKEKVA